MSNPKVQNPSKKVKPKITQKRLKELLHYDPDTGLFQWKVRLSNSTKIGDIAGAKDGHGYIGISIGRRSYNASRLAFLYMKGYFPEYDVDHRNRIRDDNKWENLRHATRSCNTRNCSISKRNKSGVTGVHWHNQTKRWASSIRIMYKNKHLGEFENLRDAAQARWDAEVKHGFPNCNTTSTAYLYLHGNQEAGHDV